MEFSVLMSVYFKETAKNLSESLDSILQNTVLPTEIVIIKDGKLTEELDTCLAEYQAKYDIIKIFGYEENRGLGLALQFGVEKCSCTWIARHDSDDICDKLRFEKQTNFLTTHPECTMVGSFVGEFIDSIDNIVSQVELPTSYDDILKFSQKRTPFRHPTLFMKKEDILRAGNYQNFYLVEDYDLITRMLQAGTIAMNIPENLVYMRVSKDFYNRRGGWKYCKSINKFMKALRKRKYISYFRYLKNIVIRTIVSLSPSWLRAWIYKHKLRKQVKQKIA